MILAILILMMPLKLPTMPKGSHVDLVPHATYITDRSIVLDNVYLNCHRATILFNKNVPKAFDVRGTNNTIVDCSVIMENRETK